MVNFIEVMASVTGFILLVYCYLVGKKEKLNLTFIEKHELNKIYYKSELCRDIALPLIVEGMILVLFAITFSKFKIISIIVLAFITLCVYALELKIRRSLFKYRKKKVKNKR